jgi:hypothetical protein
LSASVFTKIMDVEERGRQIRLKEGWRFIIMFKAPVQ